MANFCDVAEGSEATHTAYIYGVSCIYVCTFASHGINAFYLYIILCPRIMILALTFSTVSRLVRYIICWSDTIRLWLLVHFHSSLGNITYGRLVCKGKNHDINKCICFTTYVSSNPSICPKEVKLRASKNDHVRLKTT